MIAKTADMRHPVCIVDDDASVREAVGSLLRSEGLKVETFGSAREFLASPRRDPPSCLVLDVELPGLSGLDLQQELLKGNAQIPIIFLTGHGDIPMSVRAIKSGALDFLTKPVDADHLLGAIAKGIAQDHGALQSGGVVGTSQSWRDVLGQAAKVAPAETTVLLSGESGTGKEVVAHLIHRGSRRAEGPFVALNCAALPEALLESELFGYEKGAFTGAVSARAGRLEQAAGGTLFLDEVGELRPAVERALILCEGGLINPEHLPWHAESPRSPPPPPPSAAEPLVGDLSAQGMDLEAMERTLIEGALKQAGRNKSKAAKLLGLSRGKLYTRMERFGLS